jgi:hypothetical protein
MAIVGQGSKREDLLCLIDGRVIDKKVSAVWSGL